MASRPTAQDTRRPESDGNMRSGRSRLDCMQSRRTIRTVKGELEPRRRPDRVHPGRHGGGHAEHASLIPDVERSGDRHAGWFRLEMKVGAGPCECARA